MPDWSYQTLFRPLLFRLPPMLGRDLALGCMGALSRLPLGTAVIDFLGHMRPDARLSHTSGHVVYPTRVGLGARVDPQLVAVRALSQFGIGFLEVGPFSSGAIESGLIERDASAETLIYHAPHENPGLEVAVRRLDGIAPVPIFVRLDASGEAGRFELNATSIIDRFADCATGYILEGVDLATCQNEVERISQRTRTPSRRILLVAVSAAESSTTISSVISLATRGVIDGVLVDGQARDAQGRSRVGKSDYESMIQAVRMWREALPRSATIIAAGGVHEPIQALELIDAGSDLVRVDTGLIFSGPGLIKRINEALLFQLSDTAPARIPPEHFSWFWTCLIAIGMLIGGVLAMIIATTRVVMPYDEAMAGLTRAEIVQINEHLLHFMAHDRVTLAGTMLAVGILYFALSVYGSRRGMHWARRAIIVSSSAGFVSFFLFLGFGYFDPFHAFVTAVLFQLLIMGVHCGLPPYRNLVAPELTNDRAWWLSQWGQLIFIIHGAILIVAGCVISCVGISTVFVPEDLEFMHTSADHLFNAHPRLVPLIAHDRATFGGMLIACGVCVLLSSLWGFRRGHAWLWWALVTAGSIAYIATILIHWHVGYTSLHHLLPAYIGLGMIALGGALSRPHLCGGSPSRST